MTKKAPIAEQTVLERLWLWAHTRGRHTRTAEDRALWGIPGDSRITPVEACRFMGLRIAIMVTYPNDGAPPFDEEALALVPAPW